MVYILYLIILITMTDFYNNIWASRVKRVRSKRFDFPHMVSFKKRSMEK